MLKFATFTTQASDKNYNGYQKFSYLIRKGIKYKYYSDKDIHIAVFYDINELVVGVTTIHGDPVVAKFVESGANYKLSVVIDILKSININTYSQ